VRPGSYASRVTAFASLVDEFLRGHWSLNPIEASLAGIHDHDDRLGDFSARGFAEREDFARTWERRLSAVRDDELTPPERIDREVALAVLRGAIALQPFQPWRRHAPFYADAVLVGAYALLVRDFAPLEERLARIATRLGQARAVLDAATANLDPERTAPVHVVVAGETAAAGVPFVRAYLPSLAPDGPVKRDLILAGHDAAEALERYAAWLRDDFIRLARGGFAIGRETLDRLLRSQHLLDHDAVSLLRLGRAAYEETEARLSEAARTLGDAHWAAGVDALRAEHPPRERLLEDYRATTVQARQATRSLGLVTFPEREELEVVETPGFQRSTVPYASYFPPAPFETGRKGRFHVTVPDSANPRDLEQRLQGHMTKGIPLTVAHEAYPGHHLQLTIAADHPSRVRKAFGTPFFVEGWGLYCEELMVEAGYLTDPATRLLQLKDLLWRAARVIVDIGLAAGEMNFERAVNFLAEGPRLERPNAIAEVRRYTLNPTQPSSYMVGRLEILRLRDRARAGGLGLREFHDRLLGSGSIPPALAARELGL
jgi:uncharacterized protein (DUF885 family)